MKQSWWTTTARHGVAVALAVTAVSWLALSLSVPTPVWADIKPAPGAKWGAMFSALAKALGLTAAK